MVELSSKTVLVTGVTAGIGQAVTNKLLQAGCQVIGTGRRQSRLDALALQWGDRFLPLCFDVQNQSAVQHAIDGLPTRWSKIDILVNNAGLAQGLEAIDEGSIEHWDTMIDTNIKGLLYITRTVLALMKPQQSGQIIHIGSIAGREVYPGGNVYCATKSAVDALSAAMRIDLVKHGIKVSQVAPGHVETDFAKVRFLGDADRAKIYEDFQPLSAEDVAETVYFIASQPAHVNIADVLILPSQQASATTIHRSGRV